MDVPVASGLNISIEGRSLTSTMQQPDVIAKSFKDLEISSEPWTENLQEELENKSFTCKTYNEWKQNRQTADNWKERIKKHSLDISNNISLFPDLLSCLEQHEVLTDRAIDAFRSKKETETNASSVSELLFTLRTKKTFKDFLSFCKALYETNQMHVVIEFFTPEIPQSSQASADVKRPPKESIPAHIAEICVPDLRKNIYSRLKESAMKIELDHGLLLDLVSKGVMNANARETIEKGKSPIDRSKKLLEYMEKRPDEDFRLLCASLRSDNQKKVVEYWLNPESEVSPASASMATCDDSQFKELEYLEWEDVIIKQLNEIVSHLDVTPEVCNELRRLDVINDWFLPFIKERESGFVRADILLDHMRRRPPLDFAKLRWILKKEKQKVIEKAIEKYEKDKITRSNIQLGGTHSSSVPGTAKPFQNTGTLTSPIQGDGLVANKPRDDSSATTKEEKLRCYIFNNENFDDKPDLRIEGATADGTNLTEAFTNLHFNVETFNDLTAQEMTEKIDEISKMESLKDCRCLVLFFLSHGERRLAADGLGDCIYSRDVKCVTKRRLVRPLINENCKLMIDNPRVFFFIACRDLNLSATPDVDIDVSEILKPQDKKDIMLVYPTQEGYLAWFDKSYGHWYVRALKEVFSQYADTKPLSEMLETIHGRVTARMAEEIKRNVGKEEATQAGSFESNLHKPLYFGQLV